uniref:Integrase catalytic domain-containing protein n=1 Tax=Photinus pyralis TaxID=7054 RepID=A0A1Y1JXU0_PHOPY
MIQNAWICEQLAYNLLSVRKLEENGLKVVFEQNEVAIMKEEKKIIEGKLNGNLYTIKLWKEQEVNSANGAVEDKRLLHRRMGHSSKYPSPSLCDTCLKGKQSRLPFREIGESRKAKRLLEIISTDICGPITPETYDGKKYYITFIDHFSHFCVTYLLSKKSEAIEKFKIYVAAVEAKFNCKIERLRCDNGGEYASHSFRELCMKRGIKIQYNVAYNPEQNGVAERFNRTIMEMARCLMFDSSLRKEFWGEAVRTATYLINRLETKALNQNTTPAEIWYKEKQNLSKIKLFGCNAYNLVPKEVRSSKLHPRSEKMLMIGYADNGYRLWDKDRKKIVHARNVIFEEDGPEIYPNILVENPEEVDNNENIEDEQEDSIGVNDGNQMSRRSTRERRPPAYLEDYEVEDHSNLFAALSAGSMLSDVPSTYDEAVAQSGEWKNAVQKELTSLQDNKTWELVERPVNQEVIDSKWVFRVKVINGQVERKARLVARGFKQSEVDENIYTPVARMTTLRILLSIYVQNDLFFQQLDVKSAFLNGSLSSPVYMEQPQGLEGRNPNVVCKLNKALYGLKQAPKCWYSLFNKTIINLGFTQSKKDPCLYFTNTTLLLIYVDDLIMFSK